MAKISKSFRLSVQAQEYLRQLVERTGSSETALVEMALATFHGAVFRTSSQPGQPLKPGQPSKPVRSSPGTSEPEWPTDDAWISKKR